MGNLTLGKVLSLGGRPTTEPENYFEKKVDLGAFFYLQRNASVIQLIYWWGENENKNENEKENDMNNEQDYKAVFNQVGPRADVSSRYSFIPTTKVLDVLQDYGWAANQIKQSRVIDVEKDGYQSHLVRLRNPNFYPVGTTDVFYPEIVLRNSHNRGGAFELSMGVYRQVCTNGLMAGEQYGIHKIRHVGFATEKVEQAARLMADEAPRILGMVERFRSKQLSRVEQIDFALQALNMKFDPEEGAFVYMPEALLTARRYNDGGDDLWRVFNRVQENLVKGGLRYRNNSGRRQTDRAINNIARNVGINRELWNLAEQFAQ